MADGVARSNKSAGFASIAANLVFEPAQTLAALRGYTRKANAVAILGHPVAHWVMLFILAAMWGSSFGLTKVAVTAVSAEAVVAARTVIAGFIFGALIVIMRKRLPIDGRTWLIFGAMALVGICLPYWLITWGQKSVDSALAGILMASMPMITLLLAHLFVAGERMTWAKSIGFGVAFLGIVCLVGPEALFALHHQGSALLAQCAIIGGTICYAVNTILARLSSERDGLIAAASITFIANILLMPLTVSDLAPAVTSLDFKSAIAISILGIVATVLAPMLYLRLVHVAGPVFLSLINYLIPMWAVFFGVIFLDESPGANVLFSLILILAGIGLAQLKVGQRYRQSIEPAAGHSS